MNRLPDKHFNAVLKRYEQVVDSIQRLTPLMDFLTWGHGNALVKASRIWCAITCANILALKMVVNQVKEGELNED